MKTHGHSKLWLVLALGMLASLNALGDNVYRSLSRDGKVTYSDQPPSTGKVQKIYSFENLPSSPVPDRPKTQESVGQKKPSPQAPTMTGTYLYSANWCGYCRKAKAYLNQRGIAYQEIDIDTAEGGAAFTTEGRGGIPLLVRNGQRVRGFSTAAYDALF